MHIINHESSYVEHILSRFAFFLISAIRDKHLANFVSFHIETEAILSRFSYNSCGHDHSQIRHNYLHLLIHAFQFFNMKEWRCCSHIPLKYFAPISPTMLANLLEVHGRASQIFSWIQITRTLSFPHQNSKWTAVCSRLSLLNISASKLLSILVNM